MGMKATYNNKFKQFAMEEKIDILTEEGKKNGEIKSKDQIHIDGDWHLAVHVWILNTKKELLIQRRSKTKINHPDMLDISVAGHVSSGETSLQGAIREIKEEVGMDVTKNQLEKIGSVKVEGILNHGTYINKEFNDIYLVKTDLEISQMKRQVEEVDEIEFMPWKKFREKIESGQTDIVSHPEEYRILFQYLKERIQ